MDQNKRLHGTDASLTVDGISLLDLQIQLQIFLLAIVNLLASQQLMEQIHQQH